MLFAGTLDISPKNLCESLIRLIICNIVYWTWEFPRSHKIQTGDLVLVTFQGRLSLNLMATVLFDALTPRAMEYVKFD